MTQQEPKRRSSASLQHQAEHTRTRRRISVMGYLLVLFVAAFLLLLLEKQTRAMDLFWQVDEAYVRGRYVLCRQLIQSLEDLSDGAPLKSYLPTESTTDNDRFSPAERYQEIFKAVF